MAMNAAISGAVTAKNDGRVIFIDVDPDFEGHRFCESGITEPDLDTQQTWLFHLELKHWVVPTNDWFDRTQFVCDQDLQAQGDWGAMMICDWIAGGQTLQSLADEVDVQDISQLGLGDWGVIARTFHPSYAGHGMIKERIYKEVNIAQHP